MTSTQAVTHWYPASAADKRPSAWWYWGPAVYVSRRDYWKITKVFLAVGVPLGAVGVLFRIPMAFWGAVALAEIGLLLLAYSLVGLYRMYGHPGVKYVRKLVALGEVQGKVTVADLHIGTYRHAFLLSDVLPEAQIISVDCWNAEGEAPEEAVADVRDLEVPPQSDPQPYYRGLDIYVNTSLHEGLPLSVLEAMACGKPVVAARVGGIPEVVRDAEHGFLVDGREARAFAESCARLIEDPALRRTMGQNARARIAEAFGRERMAASYRALYEELCAMS